MSDRFLHWVSAHRTNVGLKRSINEDACLDLPEQGLWVVADGMGGHAGGDLASHMIVDALKGTDPGNSLGDLVGDVKRRLQNVNRRLRGHALNQGEDVIGSTVVALLVLGRYCVYLWAGDSRIYLLRRGRLKQLSRDHSQIEELVERGGISPEQADRSLMSNVITRAVGAEDDLMLDAEILEAREGDLFLLCTDGLNKEVRDEEIGKTLNDNRLSDAADALIRLTLARGARDNVTLVLAQAVQSATTS